MPFSINQGLVIDRLNRYLDWHNLPERMNTSGVCNGLATIYIKYALQGKQAEFARILTQITSLTFDPQYNEEINQFAKEVALSFMPSNYDKKLTQLHSIGTQEINGKKLTPSYNLAMTTSDNNWSKILREINLRDDEAMLVRSVNHAISISKKDGKYIIYDPNYRSGFKAFKHEKAVIRELHFNVFRYTGSLGVVTDLLNVSKELSSIALPLELYGPLSMQVEVIRHPDKENRPRAFPDVGELYQRYLKKEGTATSMGSSITNMHWAIQMNNKKALDALYEKGFKHKNPLHEVCLAAAFNAAAVLPTLLAKVSSKRDIKELPLAISTALYYGRREAFETLLADKRIKKLFRSEVLRTKNADNYLMLAARGGNVELLQKMLHEYQTHGKPIPLTDNKVAEIIQIKVHKIKNDIINQAIYSKSVDCVKLLYEQLRKANPVVGEKQLFANLVQAIKSNQPYMVQFFIDEIKNLPPQNQAHLFKSIKLNTTLVERTDISILRNLQAHEVRFSKTAKAVIDWKENRSSGAQLPIGITLTKFTEFIKEVLLNRDQVTENIKNFKAFKKQASAAKKLEPAIEKTNIQPGL